MKNKWKFYFFLSLILLICILLWQDILAHNQKNIDDNFEKQLDLYFSGLQNGKFLTANYTTTTGNVFLIEDNKLIKVRIEDVCNSLKTKS